MTQPKGDRFDLSQMVSTQLSQSLNGKRLRLYSKDEPKRVNNDWQNRALPNSVKSLLKAAHSGVKPIPLEAFQPPGEIQPDVKIDDSKTNKKKNLPKSKRKLIATRQFSYLGVPRYQSQYNNSIPQIQASWEMKAMQGGRRPSTLMAQERAREIFRQKNMLQDMLNEHQKLQKDRATIALEIQSMKSYLGQIRKRLDTSLRKLNVNVDNPFQHSKRMRRAIKKNV